MLENELNQLTIKFSANKADSAEILSDLIDLFIASEYSERDKCIEDFCELFWILACEIKKESPEVDQIPIDKLERFVNDIGILSLKREYRKIYASKGVALIQFLRILLNNDKALYDSIKMQFKIFYESIGEFTDAFSWLFHIKRKNGEYVFSMHDLLSGVIVEAKNPTKDNLIQLLFALQIYNRINFEDESLRKQIIKIARDYNVRILEYLCDYGNIIGGTLACKNNLINQVIIAQNKDKIIIRSTKRGYFNNESVLSERNHNGDEIAWFIEIKIDSNWELCSLEQILLGENSDAKKAVLLDICKNDHYNVFFEKDFIEDKENKNYLRFLNESFGDTQIITPKGDLLENNSYNFWKLIKENKNGIRSVVL